MHFATFTVVFRRRSQERRRQVESRIEVDNDGRPLCGERAACAAGRALGLLGPRAAGARGVSPARAAPTAAAQEEAPASSSPPTAPEVASEAGECSEAETPSVPPLTPGGASTAFGSPFTRCARASKPTRLLFGLCTPCRRFKLRKAQNIYATQKVADTRTHLLR